MHDDRNHAPIVNPVRAGVLGRCPRCGEGRLFDGFLAVRPRCALCGLDYSFVDAGDGPAAFVILAVGFVVVGLALWVEVVHQPPLWVHFMIWLPLAIVLSLAGIRIVKGLLITLQYANKASEGRLER